MIRRVPRQSKDVAIAVSGVDQRIRDCLQSLWLSMPADGVNIDDVESHFRRLVDRAVRDLREDMEYFPVKPQ